MVDPEDLVELIELVEFDEPEVPELVLKSYSLMLIVATFHVMPPSDVVKSSAETSFVMRVSPKEESAESKTMVVSKYSVQENEHEFQINKKESFNLL